MGTSKQPECGDKFYDAATQKWYVWTSKGWEPQTERPVTMRDDRDESDYPR
jgi:hypothetical protein